MKILYVLNSSKYGGMEWHVFDLVKGMIQKGHDIFVWCPEGEMAEIYKNVGANVTYEFINKDIDRKYIKKLHEFIVQNQIEIVHSHELKSVSNALLACRKTNVKGKISHTHTPISEWRIENTKKFLNIKFYSYIVNRHSDVEIALTESKRKVKINEGIKEQKLLVIPNGLDTSKFNISPNQRAGYEEEIKEKYEIQKSAFIFGSVGRLTVEKDHETLVRAYAKFLDSELFHKKDFHLIIAGGGPLEQKINNLIDELGLNGKVTITGRFDENEKIKYYSAFDAFIFPTLAEGFGIVLIEALYMGLPTICSDLEVLREIGDEVVEFFEAGNVHDLTKKMISEYNKTGGVGKVISDKAKMYVEDTFSMENFVNSYENLYLNLMGDVK